MVTVTETCNKLYIIEYIVVFWLNNMLVSTTTQRDGSCQIKQYNLHVNVAVSKKQNPR
jgi:hypothetical protein